MSLVETSIIVSYRQIWSDKPKNWKLYLKGIGRNTLSQFTMHFANVKNRNLTIDEIDPFLKKYISPSNYGLNVFLNPRLKSIINNKQKRISIIHSYTALKIFVYADTIVDEEDSIRNDVAEVNFFKAIFALNQEIVSSEKDSPSEDIKRLVSKHLGFSCTVLTHTFAYSDFSNYDLFDKFICEIIKAVHLFDFMEGQTEYDEVIRQFLTYYKCESTNEYLKNTYQLGRIITRNDKKDGSIRIKIPRDENFFKTIQFLDSLIFNDAIVDEFKDYDFISIRSKPLYKVSEDEYNVVFDLFAIEKIFKGQYFLFANIVNSLNDSLEKKLIQKALDGFRSSYTNDFSEKYLSNAIIKASFPTYHHLSETDFENYGIKSGAPDYYLRQGRNIFIFESKDNNIAGGAKLSGDFVTYHDFLKSRFGDEKGIGQLVNQIDNIFNGKYDSCDEALKNIDKYELKVYPILLVHHAQFNTSGINDLLNYWYYLKIKDKKEIEQLSKLIVLDIDTLILYSGSFQQENLFLAKVIEEYFNFIAITSNPYEKIISFSHFLLNSYRTNPIPLFEKCLSRFINL